MKAFQATKYGQPLEVLNLVDLPKPKPGPSEVLVKIHATAINDWEWAMVTGRPWAYRPLMGFTKPKNPVPGMELSGVVEAVGDEVKNFKSGDAVFGDTSDHGFGSYAEYISISEKALHLKPDSISFEDAAALPHASLLAWQAFVDYGKLKEGENVLINGGGGGVGALGFQIAKALGAGRIDGVDTGPKMEMMKSLGFEKVMDYKNVDFVKEGEKYDFILDCKSSRTTSQLSKALNKSGRYVTVGGTPGRVVSLALSNLFGNKRFMVLPLKPNKGLDNILRLVLEGKLENRIEGPYPFEEIPRLLQRFGHGLHTGKIIAKIT